MSGRELRRWLVTPQKRVWDRKWVLPALMGGVLLAGLGLGLGLGQFAPRPVKPAEQAPAPVIQAQEEPAVVPIVASPRPRPETGEPTEDVPEIQPAAVPLMLPQEPVKGTDPTTPAWVRYAVPAPRTAGRPMIAIVIDDLGVDRRRSDKVVQLRAPLTLAWMTYAEEVGKQAQAARARGHELIVHMPMQPQGEAYDPGRDVLEVGLSEAEIRRRVDWGLSRLDGFVGVNNHMGSKFTADRAGMRVVMEELKKRGLIWLDSVTSEKTVGPDMARRYGVPSAARHVFLDNEQDVGSVRAQLAKTEAHARKHGAAIAIGHPHDATIEALSTWLPGLEAKGFVLVPLTAIVRRNGP